MLKPGPRNALTDVPGLQVGCAQDEAAMTGVTVIVADAPAACAVEIAGGGPGTRETDVLRAGNLVDAVDALVFAGGSVYGLAAADAVVAALGARGRGYALRDIAGAPRAPIVPSAILYDLANGGDKAWGETPPYHRLGRAAFDALGADVPLGNAGAGHGALAGALKGGQGSASARTEDGHVVAALACVNSFGSTTMPGARAFWAWPFEIDGEFGALAPPSLPVASDDWSGTKLGPRPRANTTLAVVATDAPLRAGDLKRVAQMASAGLARAIRPIFSPFDGDVMFALCTGARGGEGDPMLVARIGALAADCAARAVARGVYEARTLGPWTAWRDA